MIMKLDQKKWRIGIMLQQHLAGGYLEAVVARKAGQIEYYINNNVHIPDTLTEDAAREYGEWLGLAASTLEMLKRTITTPADFDKQWRARIVGRTVVIDEVKEAVTA